MGIHTFCQEILNDMQTPCFLCDFDSHKILYINGEMQKLLMDYGNVLEKVFYEVIFDRESQKSFLPQLEQISQQSVRYDIFDEGLNVHFTVTHSLMEYQKKSYLLCKYSPLRAQYSLDFDEAMTKSIYILQQEDEKIIPSFLALLGEFYQVEKSYLYHIDYIERAVTCTASWVLDGSLSVTRELSQVIDVEIILDWLESANEAGILEENAACQNFDSDSSGGKVLRAFGLENIVLSMVQDNEHKTIGVVALSNRKAQSAVDYRLLQTITRFMEQNVTKSEMQNTLLHMSHVDILTGFCGRASYSKQIDTFQENPPKTFGVVFVNVNGLKQINVEYGFAKGDSYIKKVANSVKNYFESTFFRISGDEFVAFFPDMEKAEFEGKVTRIYETLKAEKNDSFAFGHSWGEGRYDVVKLIREADTVMYINKQEYYHSSSRRFEEIGDSTLSDLLCYLENDEFMVYLQPQVVLKDGSLYGAEALIRRFDKTNQKMVFPDQFIPLYEKKSVIRHVDIFVVEKVCQLLQQWGGNHRKIPISVNLSRVTLLEFGIVGTIAEICDKYEIAHELLVIEVTERVGLIENNVASSLIRDFKEQGFKISLDDFGCAYSNIVTLAQISVDEVKVDKSLVDYLVTNHKNRVLVKNILTMCNELENTSTLAEGIEEESQAQLLREYHCHLGQGYLYSRPIPAQEFFEKYLENEGQK